MVKKKIYTRTGDKGETSLFTGQRVQKNDPFIQALGAVDDCNSSIGFAISLFPLEENSQKLLENAKKQLIHIQHALFDVGAAIATPRTTAGKNKIEKTRFDMDAILLLETWMDEMDENLPALHQFILPGGHPAGASLHNARSACRRAEQLVVPLYEHSDVSEGIIRYLNRLSDYLFMASRFINHQLNIPETKWQQHKVLEQ